VKSSKGFRWLGVPPLVLVALVLAPVAYATPPNPGGGTVTFGTATVTSTRSADGNTVITELAPATETGTYNGTSVADERVVIHPNGDLTGTATETFSGIVDGVAGTVVFVDVFRGNATTGVVTGSYTVVSGTGGLADLHDHGTFEVSGSTGTYQANGHFGP
jgi:hypothetical protein